MIGILKSLKERELLTEEQMNLCIKKLEGENLPYLLQYYKDNYPNDVKTFVEKHLTNK